MDGAWMGLESSTSLDKGARKQKKIHAEYRMQRGDKMQGR